MSIFTVPPGESFVDALARRLLEEYRENHLGMAEMLILLPTRRACRALQDAFLRAGDGAPLLLPRLQPLGDDDEEDQFDEGLDLPPAAPPLHRQLLLARLVQSQNADVTPEQAARLADELGRLLDQVQTEELSFAGLARLVPDELAEHWKITLDFLKILTEHWPAILAERGWCDGAWRRAQTLSKRAAAWRDHPPDFPIIAAGSTGSQPATARLLAAVALLPKGRLVLPGLDRRLTAEEQAVLDHTHPQYALLRLVQALGLTPDQVPLWPGCSETPRAEWVAEALRPAATTEHWRGRPVPADAFAGVTRLDCPAPREEAAAIALMMRETLERPGERAALVTPDRDLARRVAAELQRFDIEIDDSAGRPLAVTPPGSLLALTARMVAEDFAPQASLAALKHPLIEGDKSPVRRLEIQALRGPRPAPGIEGMAALCGEDLQPWLRRLRHLANPLIELMSQPSAPLDALIAAHLALVEGLAPETLWQGDDGRAAHRFLADLLDAAPLSQSLAGRHYPGLLEELMRAVTVRPTHGRHPRLAIWGPLEARLQQTDLLILGGLNEGVWPPEPSADPWMSRPMRGQFGLAPPERRIGLAAHDFAQGLCAAKVALTRSLRSGGAPTVPSRWLLRLDALRRGQSWPQGDWLGWAQALDRPRLTIETAPPAPRPPLAARPRELPVTAIELWMRDPYGLYARYVLDLRALEPIDADPAARDYGNAVHRALELFLKKYAKGPLPADALEQLLALGRETLRDIEARPGLWAFWWPRFASIAAWLIGIESARRASLIGSFAEIKGRMALGDFTLTAKADRIDLLREGGIAIIDYKTGAPPTAREVAAGYAPQMPLEAMIAEAGGFAEVGPGKVKQLWFWRLKGGREGGEQRWAGDDIGTLIEQAGEGLAQLIERFDDPNTPYESRPHPDHAPKYSDYGHLARLQEWSGGEDQE